MRNIRHPWYTHPSWTTVLWLLRTITNNEYISLRLLNEVRRERFESYRLIDKVKIYHCSSQTNEGKERKNWIEQNQQINVFIFYYSLCIYISLSLYVSIRVVCACECVTKKSTTIYRKRKLGLQINPVSLFFVFHLSDDDQISRLLR